MQRCRFSKHKRFGSDKVNIRKNSCGVAGVVKRGGLKLFENWGFKTNDAKYKISTDLVSTQVRALCAAYFYFSFFFIF